MKLSNVKGIIFDMDNTILRSKINFDHIKYEINNYLISSGLFSEDFPIEEHTSSSLIEYLQRSQMLNEEMMREVWNICTKHELIGMQGADLEDGATELLKYLKDKYRMVILTNNSFQAAEIALKENKIDYFFDHIIGREQVKLMKPAPDGVLAAINRFDFEVDEWISVGDAWVDGKASKEAGVKFISYQGDLAIMNEKGVEPIVTINKLEELLQYIV